MKFLRPRELAEALSISTTTLWRWRRSNGFPAPFQLGANTVAWDEDEIRQWLQARRILNAVVSVADEKGVDASQPTSTRAERRQGVRRLGRRAKEVAL
jgi:predicted DNA-binding transcriptional regulator AlpA